MLRSQYFAITELKTVAIMLLKNFDFSSELVPKYTADASGIVLREKVPTSFSLLGAEAK